MYVKICNLCKRNNVNLTTESEVPKQNKPSNFLNKEDNKDISLSSLRKINPICHNPLDSTGATGGGKSYPNFIFWIARLTDDPLKWAYTLWKSIVLRIPKSTRPFPWVVWELSNSRSKLIDFIAKNSKFSRGEKSRLKKFIFYFL